jgi:hypothetical protein
VTWASNGTCIALPPPLAVADASSSSCSLGCARLLRAPEAGPKAPPGPPTWCACKRRQELPNYRKCIPRPSLIGSTSSTQRYSDAVSHLPYAHARCQQVSWSPTPAWISSGGSGLMRDFTIPVFPSTLAVSSCPVTGGSKQETVPPISPDSVAWPSRPPSKPLCEHPSCTAGYCGSRSGRQDHLSGKDSSEPVH